MVNLKLKTGKIYENIKIAKDTFFLKFHCEEKFFPTQFILVDTYPVRFLLKPFSITVSEKNFAGIIYRVLGEGTYFLTQKKPNDEIKFLGPFGNLSLFNTVIKQIDKNRIYFLAGGIGIAPIIFLYNYISNFIPNIKIFYGEREKRFVINLKKFNVNDIVYSTDDGSYGEKGLVTDVFKKYIKKCDLYSTYIFCCGPKKMLKEVQKIVFEQKILHCYTLLEEYMCCGVGLCRSCVVKIKSGDEYIYKPVCKEGPLFNIKEVIF